MGEEADLGRIARDLAIALHQRRGLAIDGLFQFGATVETVDIDADGVVLAVPPSAVERITGRRLPSMHAVRVACLDLGLRTLPNGSARVALAIDQPLYLSAHSIVARLAPPGSALVHLCKYLRDEGDAIADRRDLEAYADLAIPEWRGQAEIVRFLPGVPVHTLARGAVDAPAELLDVLFGNGS